MKRVTFTHEEYSTVEVFEVRDDGSILWTVTRELAPMGISAHFMRDRIGYLVRRGYTRTES